MLASVLAAGIAGLDARRGAPAADRGERLGPPAGPLPAPADQHHAGPPTRSRPTPDCTAVLGADFVRYWLNTRRWEWLMFHTTGGDPMATAVTPWELDRYFELS